MRIIKQLLWIFFFSLLGEILSSAITNIVAIPGSVIGMVLLFLALHSNILKLEQVDEVGTWLTDNMAIFFVPAGVGLMTNFDVLAQSWLQLLIIMGVTCGAMMLFVGKLVQRFKDKSPETDDLEEVDYIEGVNIND